MQKPINGLVVKPSYDFVARVKVGKETKTVCVIFNVSSEISNSDAKLGHHAKIESEVAYDIIINSIPLDEVWFIDLSNEKIVRRLKKPLVSVKRDIEATCDDIMLRYHSLIAKRSQGTA